MRLVIKIGGQALDHEGVRRDVARQVAQLHRRGHAVAVVHGGGPRLTQTLAQMGLPSRFHQGLRITDRTTRDVALMVLAGYANKQWVAALETAGVTALGLCGGDAKLVQARKLAAKGCSLGWVGIPYRVNRRILEVAFREGIVPVVASLARGRDGQYLNVNADDFAAALASALKADRLLYVTEAGGVWDAKHRLLPVVRRGEIRQMIRDGVVRNGMIPKLLSCARILSRGVGEVDIISPSGLLASVAGRNRGGTRVVDRAETR